MSKNRNIYICSNCGSEFPRWSGQCPNCQEWNTLEESEIIKQESGIIKAQAKGAKALSLSQINLKEQGRVSTGLLEFDRVLGGEKIQGLVPGEVVLVSGDPGIGKSTLLLQTLFNLAKNGKKSMYVSAEESQSQIAMRAERLMGKDKLKKDSNLKLISTFDLDSVLTTLEKEKSEFVVVDSIQTISTDRVRGMAGGIAQVKASAIELVNFAKSRNVTMLIVGHINKEGNVAGPKVLEHLVDAVLQIEGEERNGFRILRSLKNRFGTTNEVGILAMTDQGLKDMADAGNLFVSKESLEGVCRSATLEGNRIVVIEIQALTNTTSFSQPKRVAEGISYAKLQVICAILAKHAGLKLYDKDVYVNIAGGLRVRDPSIDLAVALAIASSLKSKALPADMAAVGELSLTGRVGMASRLDSRKSELKKMGFGKIVDSSTGSEVRKFVVRFLSSRH